LPGIIGDRFFSVLDLNGDGYVDVKEFIHGFFKVYYSNLETKIKLAFDMYPSIFIYNFTRYDFDKDGYIKKEDVRLILSYIPIEKSILGKAMTEEGKFSQEGGGK
jgi:Ca2+-binding EF-hand superfamily protein